MLNSLLGIKNQMSQDFVDGKRVPITIILTGPCVVTQIKNPDKDGYWAVQLGLGEKKAKKITRAMYGHLRKVIKENKAPLNLGEIRLNEEPNFKIGDIIKVSDIFSEGDSVAIRGISKGKGFAGVVKRHHFKGGPRSHGQSDRERAPGSIGQTTTPGRVFKGKKMAGRMGSDMIMVKNLKVVHLDTETNTIAVSGPVPGISGTLLKITKL